MANHLPASLLAPLSRLVAAQTGLHFPQERWGDLARGIRAAAGESGVEDAVSYSQSLLSAPWCQDQVERLVKHLTVGETYFFRERATFAALEQHILPPLIHARRRTDQQLRIWSAGCCTGEEPYSVAILLNQLLPDWQDWRITLLATDINPDFLHKAAEGVYGEWSFRDVPVSIKERYFTRIKTDRYAILPEIKQWVTFSRLNLVEDDYLSLLNQIHDLDLILCRNVLMYFAPEQQRRVVQVLYRSLMEGGWLIVGASEVSPVLFRPFALVNPFGVTCYQKTHHCGQRVAAVDPEASACSGVLDEQEIEQEPADPALQIQVEAGLLPAYPTAGWQKAQDPQPDWPHTSAHAVELAERAAPAQPTSYSEAAALYEQGCLAAATAKLVEWLAQHPRDVEAMVLLARIYANQRRLAEALEWCKTAIAVDRLNASGYYLQATIQEEQGQTEQATQSLKQALYLAPDFVLAHFALGNLMLRLQRVGEANKCFANTLTLLRTYRPEEPLPESAGFTAGRLSEIICARVHPEQRI